MKKISRYFALMMACLLWICGSAIAQQEVTVKGKVLSESGEELGSATIMIEHLATGRQSYFVSDSAGVFVIPGLEAGQRYSLYFDHVGYASDSLVNLTFSATENNALLVRMKPGTGTTLGEVVVTTALGIKRAERSLSYSAQQISAEDLTKVKDANFVNSLQGKVAGVTINSSSSGIGGATKVVMRGVKSISKGNNALYVIDGVPMYNSVVSQGADRFASQGGTEGAADINPDDIETMSILTGAAAAALYGSEAANGVVLITTKKGKMGKLSLNLSTQSDYLSPFVLPRFQSKYGSEPGQLKSWGAELEAGQNDYDPARFFNTGRTLINSLSLSTGNAQNQTFFSASSTNSSGVIPNNRYDRYNVTFRNTTKFFNDKMTLDVGANYVKQEDRNMRNQGEYFNPIVPVYLFPRGEDFSLVRSFEQYDAARGVSLPYWPYGSGDFSVQNPYWLTHRVLIGSKKDRYMLTGSYKYDFLDWLSFSTRGRIDNSVIKYEDKRFAGTLLQFTGNSDKGFYSYNTELQKQTYVDAMLMANKNLNDFSINANAGGIFSDLLTEANGFRAPLDEKGVSNFFSPYNQRRTGQDANPIVGYNGIRTYSLFFSAELGWQRKLYATVTGRNEWPSQLVNTKNTSYFYPSIGLSAVISDMLEMPDAVSYLKLRSSYASVGNPPPFGLSTPTYSYNNQTGLWAPPGYLPITELFPERTNSWEAGVSARFFRNKLTLDATYYHSNTYKQTFNPSITPSSGYSTMYVQSGNIENKGVEAVLGYSQKVAQDFSWDTKFTFSANKNKIVELANNYVDPTTGESKAINEMIMGGAADARFILRKGGTLGDLYSFADIKRDENGQVFVDKDGYIFADNNRERYLGTVFPKYNMGWSNEFSYKGISLGFLFAARIGGIVISPTQAVLDNYGVSEVSAEVRDQGGVNINNGKIAAKNWFDVVSVGQGMMAYYTYSASNVRLQEAHLNYQLPAKFLRNIGRLSVGILGRNLLMIYNKAPFDPETTASTGNYYQGIDYFMMPSLRNIGFNIKLQF